MSPTSAGPGSTVTITGTGFGASRGSGIVWLGSTPGLVQNWSDTQVVATVAASSVTGVARIQQNGLWSNALTFTMPGNTTVLVPNIVSMAVGDTLTIQASTLTGQPLGGLTWTTSDPAIVALSTDSPPVLTAMAPGHATIIAGTASVDVMVAPGDLPQGTVVQSGEWVGGAVDCAGGSEPERSRGRVCLSE